MSGSAPYRPSITPTNGVPLKSTPRAKEVRDDHDRHSSPASTSSRCRRRISIARPTSTRTSSGSSPARAGSGPGARDGRRVRDRHRHDRADRDRDARDRVQPAQRADRAPRRRRRSLARRARVARRHVHGRDDRQRRVPTRRCSRIPTGTCSTCITGTRRAELDDGPKPSPAPPSASDPAAAERGEVGARARQADRPGEPVVPGPDAAPRRAPGRRAPAGADDDRRPALHRGAVRGARHCDVAARSGAQHRDHLGPVRSAAAGRPGARLQAGDRCGVLAGRPRNGTRRGGSRTADRRLPLGNLRRGLAAGARESAPPASSSRSSRRSTASGASSRTWRRRREARSRAISSSPARARARRQRSRTPSRSNSPASSSRRHGTARRTC